MVKNMQDKGNRKCSKSECTQPNKSLKIYFLHLKEKTYSVYLGLTFQVSHSSPQSKQHLAFRLLISAQRQQCQQSVQKAIILLFKQKGRVISGLFFHALKNKQTQGKIYLNINRFYYSENSLSWKKIAYVWLAVKKVQQIKTCAICEDPHPCSGVM